MDDIENISEVTNALQTLIQSKVKAKPETGTRSSGSIGAAEAEGTEQDPKEKLNQRLKNLINSSTII